jgi:hypothetical protein
MNYTAVFPAPSQTLLENSTLFCLAIVTAVSNIAVTTSEPVQGCAGWLSFLFLILTVKSAMLKRPATEDEWDLHTDAILDLYASQGKC